MRRILFLDQLTTRAYQLIRLYVLDKYTKGNPLPDITDHQFCQMALSIVSRSLRKGRPSKQPLKGELEQFYQDEYKPLLSESNNLRIPSDKMSEVLAKVAIEMATMYSNNLSVHFLERLKRHYKNDIYRRYQKRLDDAKGPKKKQLQYRIKRSIQRFMDAIWDRDPTDLSLVETEIYNYYVESLLPEEYEKGNIAYDLKSNPSRYLLYNLRLSQVFEREGVRQFQPLSLRQSAIPCHIPINMKALIYLMDFSHFYACGGNKSKLIKNALTLGIERDVWNHYFNMDDRCFKDSEYYTFYNRIDTDGVHCAITFILKTYRHMKFKPSMTNEDTFKILTVQKDSVLTSLKGRPQVGNDPGKYYLLQMADEQGKHLRYNRKQRAQESYQNQNQRVRNRLRQEPRSKKFTIKMKGGPSYQHTLKTTVEGLETSLSVFNSMSMSTTSFKEYLKEKNKVLEQVMVHYQNIVYRKLKMRGFIYEKKSIDRLLNNISTTFGENVVIGYGNWSFTQQTKYNPPVMNKGLRRKVEKRFTTYSIDEFNTSKRDYKCGKELEHHIIDGEKHYRCLVCKECQIREGHIGVRYVNRDINAALNICMCLRVWIENKTRPVHLRRTPT